MHQISAETLTLVRRAIENFVLASDVWLAHRSELEQSEASEFGIPFTPSPLYRTAQRTAEVYKRILPKLEPDGSNPLSRLQFLQLD
jgi:hypothetical protein